MAITAKDREKAFELFAAGTSTNQVAGKLFKRNFAKAQKLREEYDAANGIETLDDCRAQQPDAEEGLDAWSLTINVPTERLDGILLRFSPQEKADAIASVLEARLAVEA